MNKLAQFSFTKMLPLLTLASMLLVGCKKDPVPLQDPTLSINGDAEVTLKPGATIVVNLRFNGDGGARGIIVRFNNGFLQEIPVGATDTEFTYNTRTVPANAGEGDVLEYDFRLVNRDGTESAPATFKVNVALYDPITIGTTQLFNIAIPSDGIVPSGNTVRLITGRNYYISRSVIFAPGATLEIQQGVTVYLNADATTPIEVEIQGTAQIVGTATAPVVMTSSRVLTPATPPAPGNWTWFRLTGTGNASNNGRVSYLRLEYPGVRAFRLDNVGAATVIDHIQVFKSSGEGYMITNGNAQLKYVVATDCEGGSYRLGDAYAGRMQFVIAVSTDRYAENDDFSIRETASPVIANATILGPGSDKANTHGVRFRGSSAGKMYNSIVAAFPRRGVRAHEQVTINGFDGPTVFAHSFAFDIPTDPYREAGETFAGTFDATTGNRLTNPFFNNVTNRLGSTYTLETIAGIGVSAFVPSAERTSTFNPTSLNAFFSAAPFVGAVRNSAEDWTRGWVKNPNGSVRN